MQHKNEVLSVINLPLVSKYNLSIPKYSDEINPINIIIEPISPKSALVFFQIFEKIIE